MCLGCGYHASLVVNPSGYFGGYGVAIASHPLIEGNNALVRPHTVWAALSDMRMFALAVSGRLKDELDKHNIGKLD